MMVVSASTGPAASVVVNRFGYRATTMIGSLMSTTGFIISAFTPNLATLYFTYSVLAGTSNNSNNNSSSNHGSFYGAVVMTKVIARVHPVHLMNAY